MRCLKLVILLLVIYFLFSMAAIKADSFDLQLSGNRIFFQGVEETGMWWKSRLTVLDTQGLYIEHLTVGDYYSQFGAGLEAILLNLSIGQVWSLVGGEEYKLFDTKNAFFRTGLRLEYPTAFGELDFTCDLIFDNEVGIFPRYYVELNLTKWWLKGNFGAGNLLGTEEGYAIWIGIEL